MTPTGPDPEARTLARVNTIAAVAMAIAAIIGATITIAQYLT